MAVASSPALAVELSIVLLRSRCRSTEEEPEDEEEKKEKEEKYLSKLGNNLLTKLAKLLGIIIYYMFTQIRPVHTCTQAYNMHIIVGLPANIGNHCLYVNKYIYTIYILRT